MKRLVLTILTMLPFLFVGQSCEVVDNDPDRYLPDSVYVGLEDVAHILSAIPISSAHLDEVYSAVTSSSDNGYDEEYTMSDLFESPGSGVGDEDTKSKAEYKNPLRDLIREYVREVCRRSLLPGYLIRTNGLMNFRSRICRSIGRNPRTGTARPFRS